MIAWLHCPSGASGDMLLGALIDAGVSVESVRSAVGALPVERLEIGTHQVTRRGIAATQVVVRTPETTARRTWADVRALLEAAELPEPIRDRALDVFERLARAEAAVHGTQPESVHFHEVGALDALTDVVGTCAAFHALGIGEVHCSPVALGTGTAYGRHGPLPVPGPAVLELLREAAAPVYTTDVPYELCTPTGAALLAATVTRWGGMPPLRIHATGAGAGTRDLIELPNVARVVLGESAGEQGDAAASADAVTGADAAAGAAPPAATEPGMALLETNVDDLDPRVWPAVLDRLLAAGAADAWVTPILMKKGRPAHVLSVLVDASVAEAVRRVVFTETSTLGIRERRVHRRVLDRDMNTVAVEGHPIRVKRGYLDGEAVTVQPEYDDVVAAADALDRPVRAVLADATTAARQGRCAGERQRRRPGSAGA